MYNELTITDQDRGNLVSVLVLWKWLKVGAKL